MSIKLDLKNFKFKSSDGKSTTLEHKKGGHSITLAHNVLSPDNQTQLKALSKVGNEAATSNQKQEAQDPYGKVTVKPFAGGGAVDQSKLTDTNKSSGKIGQLESFAKSLGMPVQGLFDMVGMSAEDGTDAVMSKVKDLLTSHPEVVQKAQQNATPPPPQFNGQPIQKADPAQQLNLNPQQLQDRDATLAGQGQYEQQLNQKTQAQPTLDPEAPVQDPGSYTNYSKGGPVKTLDAGELRTKKGFWNSEQGKQALGAQNKEVQNIRNAPQKFADGGEPQADDAQAPQSPFNYAPPENMSKDPNNWQNMKEDAPPIDPDTVATRKLYNNMLSGGGGNPNGGNVKGPGVVNDYLFGPNGELPKQFDAASYQQAMQANSQQKNDNANGIVDKQQEIIKLNATRTAAGLPPLPVPNVPNGPQMPGSEANPVPGMPSIPDPESSANNFQAQQQGSDANNNDFGVSNAQNLLAQGYKTQQAGIQNQATAQGALGTEQSKLYEQNLVDQKTAQNHYQKAFDDLNNERQAHISDIQNGYIDPEKYWDGHSKIASGIGMILAGFNPTNRPNAAIEFLQHQMDNNLKAQSENLGAKKTLLEANLRQFGNIRDATDMTRLMQADIVHNALANASAKAQTPLAKAAADQASGQLMQQYAPIQQQFAMRQAMMNLANGGGSPNQVEHLLSYMRLSNPEQAKEMENRYVPGVGLANVPVPNEARQQIINTKNVNDLMNRSIEFSKAHAGSTDPKVWAQAGTIQNQLIGTIKQAQHDGVYKPSEAEFLVSQIGGSPASFMAKYSSVPKIQELQQIKQQEYANLLKTNGLQPQALPQARGQQQPQYKTVNGVRYMRGPDGNAVRVK